MICIINVKDYSLFYFQCQPLLKYQSSNGGGGGPNSQKGSVTENFNMAKINNLAIPGGGGVDVYIGKLY